jgi:hypothetical protein
MEAVMVMDEPGYNLDEPGYHRAVTVGILVTVAIAISLFVAVALRIVPQ